MLKRNTEFWLYIKAFRFRRNFIHHDELCRIRHNCLSQKLVTHAFRMSLSHWSEIQWLRKYYVCLFWTCVVASRLVIHRFHIYECRLNSSWTRLITPCRDFVEVRWRSLFQSTSLGKRCTSYNALPTSRKRVADCWWLRNFLPRSSIFMVGKVQKSLGTRSELNSVFGLEKVDGWNLIRSSAVQSRFRPMRFLGFSNHEKGAPRQEISKWSTVCSTFSCDIMCSFLLWYNLFVEISHNSIYFTTISFLYSLCGLVLKVSWILEFRYLVHNFIVSLVSTLWMLSHR
jgi:hypothetical protein